MIKKEALFCLSDVPEIALQNIKSIMNDFSIFIFKGPLGAGKTTLIREILGACGVRDVITSPTFTYVNSYTNGKGERFHHFDLYRIGSIDEFFSMGFDEYFYIKNEWCFIEWPEVIMDLLCGEGVKERVYEVDLHYVEHDLTMRRFIGLQLFQKKLQSSTE
jgi:tRNA threonylcarbamoyladenosine biosynthesis protein TsaE